jgi:hypothetical protein
MSKANELMKLQLNRRRAKSLVYKFCLKATRRAFNCEITVGSEISGRFLWELKWWPGGSENVDSIVGIDKAKRPERVSSFSKVVMSPISCVMWNSPLSSGSFSNSWFIMIESVNLSEMSLQTLEIPWKTSKDLRSRWNDQNWSVN